MEVNHILPSMITLACGPSANESRTTLIPSTTRRWTRYLTTRTQLTKLLCELVIKIGGACINCAAQSNNLIILGGRVMFAIQLFC